MRGRRDLKKKHKRNEHYESMQALRVERIWGRMPLQPDRQASAWVGEALHLVWLYGHGCGMSLQSDGDARAVDGGFAVSGGLPSDFWEGILLPS